MLLDSYVSRTLNNKHNKLYDKWSQQSTNYRKKISLMYLYKLYYNENIVPIVFALYYMVYNTTILYDTILWIKKLLPFIKLKKNSKYM